MLNILFIGDINGKIGRGAIKALLPKIKKEYKTDFVIANAENLAHGKGVSETTLKEMIEAGVDCFTNGDHSFDSGKIEEIYSGKFPLLRPANYSDEAPGEGYKIFEVNGKNVLVINLIGRVFMSMDYNCPFREFDKILANIGLAEKNISAIIVDIHAEATSEKVAFGHYADGRASAVFGTHTHIMTADQKVTEKGTAYITDVGMVGSADGVIGVDKENIIKTFLTQIKYPHIIHEKGKAVLNSVLLAIDEKTRKVKEITPITKFIEIK